MSNHIKRIGVYCVEEMENGSLEISTNSNQHIFTKAEKMCLYEFLNEGYDGKTPKVD